MALSRRLVGVIVAIAIINLLAIVIYGPSHSPHLQSILKGSTHGDEADGDGEAAVCPSAKFSIAVAVKTGATEALKKLPTVLQTSLRCIPDPLLFSDLDQVIKGHQVYDVLAKFTPSVMENNTDFDLYRQQQALARESREGDILSLNEKIMHNADWRTGEKNIAWGLDKYKFLHEVERAWEMAPGRDWYFLMEADTYLNWPNLVRWLDQRNSQRRWYFGNALRMDEHPGEFYFGHGGAGIILSGLVVKEFAKIKYGLANRWDHRIEPMVFGDYVLAAALDEELDVRITKSYPFLHQHLPALVPFGGEEWCRPIVTLHHMDGELLEQMRDLEDLYPGRSLRFRDLYYSQGFDELEKSPNRRENWDNWAGDLPLAVQPLNYTESCTSLDACEQACREIDSCYQFSYTLDEKANAPPGRHCMLSSVFRFGQPLGPAKTDAGSKTWTSGWMTDRIVNFVAQQETCEVWKIPWPR